MRDRSGWNCIELYWVPGIWKICENYCWTVSCVHNSSIKFVYTYVTNRLKVSKITGGQVIHKLNHTSGGQTWMWNHGTPMTFSNQLLCHSCMERHPNTIFRIDKAHKARPRQAKCQVHTSQFLKEYNTQRSLPSPGHMGPTAELLSVLDFSGTNYGRP